MVCQSKSQGVAWEAYVATTLLVVVVIVTVPVLTVLVGVAAVMVVVVFALPEYAVAGGGVLERLAWPAFCAGEVLTLCLLTICLS